LCSLGALLENYLSWLSNTTGKFWLCFDCESLDEDGWSEKKWQRLETSELNWKPLQSARWENGLVYNKTPSVCRRR
jgi:hypothetical protein